MNEEKFIQLCMDTSFLLAQEDVESLGKYGKITILNSAMTIFFDEEIDSKEIVLYVDIVPLNNTDRESILSILMGMNLLNNHALLGVCAFDPIRNTAVLKKTIPISSAFSSNQFAMILVDSATYVQQLCAQLPDLISNLKRSFPSKNQILQSA
jgi:hypothetical protein